MIRLRLLMPLIAGLVLHAISTRPASAAAPAEPFRFPEKQHGKGELKYINKIPVLTVEGTPEEIGEQVGVLALKTAVRVLEYPRGLLDSFSDDELCAQMIRHGKTIVDLYR